MLLKQKLNSKIEEDNLKRAAESKKQQQEEQAQYFEELGLPRQLAYLSPNIANQYVKDKFSSSQAKEQTPFSPFEISSFLNKIGVDSKDQTFFTPENFQAIASKANELMPVFGKEQALFQAIQQAMNPNAGQVGGGQEEALGFLNGSPQGKGGQESEGFFDVINKGLQSGIPGRMAAISSGEGEKSFQERTQVKQPNWWKNIVHGLSKFAGESPFYAAGGAAGAAAGSPLGPGAVLTGGAGAIALPAAIETGLQEYQKFLDKGGEGTFGDFLNSADKTLKSGVKGAGEGTLFGALGPLKVLSKIPGGKKLLNLKGGKAAQSIIDSGTKAGIFTSAQGASQGRIPSAKEYGENIGMFLGFDLFGKAGKYADKVYEMFEKSNIPPDQAAARIQEKVTEEGYDLDKPSDVVRVVKDITSERSKGREVVTEKLKETVSEPENPKEVAKKLAERPIEEYIKKEEEAQKKKNRPPTEKEKAKREQAGEQAKEVEKKLEEIEDQIDYLRKSTERGTAESKKLADYALKSKLSELDDLRVQHEDLSSIAKKGVAPFRESNVLPYFKEHMSKMNEAAEKPRGKTATEWKHMFERDQKYIDEALSLAEKTPLEAPKYLDRYIKALDVYNKGYERLLKDVSSKLESKELSPKDRKILERLDKIANKNIEINRAKVGRQKDKISSLQQLKKPTKALIKQHLKMLRPEIKSLQKDFIKQLESVDDLSRKTHEIERRSIFKEKPSLEKMTMKNAESIAEKAENAPIEKEVKKAAKEMNVSPSSFAKFVKEAKTELPEIIRNFRADPTQGIKRVRALYRHLPFLQQVVAGAAISSVLKNLGMPWFLRMMFVPSNSVIRVMSTGLEKIASDQFTSYRRDAAVKKLVEARQESLAKGVETSRKLEKDLSPADYKAVIKLYKEFNNRF